MKRLLLPFLLLLAIGVHAQSLWYTRPARDYGSANAWMEYALPIGNGHLGACLFGGVNDDEVQFNEKTLWTGSPNDIGWYGQYKNFGSLHIQNLSPQEPTTYRRYLSLDEGEAGVDYCCGTSLYTRRYFASYPDNLIAIRYEAQGEPLHLQLSLTPGEGINASAVTYGANGTGRFSGALQTVSYAAQFQTKAGGENVRVTCTENGIEVHNASTLTVLLSAMTSYDASSPTLSSADDIPTLVDHHLQQCSKRSWRSLRKRHIQDHQSLFGRVRLQLGNASSDVPTDELVRRYNDPDIHRTGTEPDVLFLEQLYFAYGRYLELASSRGVAVPSNLQGIWNDRSNAPWGADIHSNINVQMNYWPAEPTNLSETHLPYLEYIINMSSRPTWQRIAREYAGVQHGWTCLTENNIYGGMSTWASNYFVANAWYCQHLWQHYRYTLDRAFLAHAFPTMWSCAQFWMERMTQDEDGMFVAPNEFSPEQYDHMQENGTAHAQQLIYALFRAVRQSVDVLGAEDCGLTEADVAQLNHYIENTDRGLHTETYLARTDVHPLWTHPRHGVQRGDTILREWKHTSYEASRDPNHRHLSHLMALYPLSDLPTSSPFFRPAVRSLMLRGDEATGWSMGWKVNLWARALDGDHAHRILRNALRHSTSYDVDEHKGGVYYNLFDSHAPFQIDGNFGVCAGMAEMLLQSHTDTLQLLPALPRVWQKGEAKGLCAVGAFVVDQQWDEGRLTQCIVTSRKGGSCVIRYPGIAHYRIGAKHDVLDANTIRISMRRGQRARLLQAE